MKKILYCMFMMFLISCSSGENNNSYNDDVYLEDKLNNTSVITPAPPIQPSLNYSDNTINDTPEIVTESINNTTNYQDYSGYNEEEEEVSDINYDEEDNSFGDYECTDDCGGHEAGYNWAEEKGIDNEDDCGGNSNSFIEGCMQYVEDNY